MKEYYYSDGKNQFGPLTIEDLKKKNILRDTLVWYDGLENWTKASDLEDFATFFKSNPPPLSTTTLPPSLPVKKKSKKMKWFVLAGIFLLLIATALIILINGDFLKNQRSTNSNSSNNSSSSLDNNYDMGLGSSNIEDETPIEKSPEQLKKELKSKEKRNPKSYLSVTYNLNYKVFSGKDLIKGTIYNSASMATFKDIVLKITYSTNTNTLLSSEEYVVYQYIKPGSSAQFQIKTYSPNGTKKIGVTIKSASTD
jgi:hypothetical protein